MIGISKLYCGAVEASDPLRYNRQSGQLPSHLLQFSKDKKPVVVWNIGRQCNLHCAHCYTHSDARPGENELSLAEGFRLLDDLAGFGAPVVLFSGGEPLLNPHLTEWIRHAVKNKLRAVVSTNGTLITPEKAEELRSTSVGYVGISLDGLEAVNDRFRGRTGAFRKTLNGIRACLNAGVKVGLRFTITRRNWRDLPGLFRLIEDEGIPRVCFYHLVYAGRGSDLRTEGLNHEESRQTVTDIMDWTRQRHALGRPVEALTVDNHCDGPYLYLRLSRENPARAEEVLTLLKMNGGNSSGRGIACISWDGAVHPDQFWRHHLCGNVREKPFSQIWGAPDDPLLLQLRERKKYLKGRCAACRWLDICNGNFRVRAEAHTGDLWAPDPDCYLTDDEIGLA